MSYRKENIIKEELGNRASDKDPPEPHPRGSRPPLKEKRFYSFLERREGREKRRR